MSQQEQHPAISDLCQHLLATSKAHKRHVPLPVAAIRVLLSTIRRSRAETMMGLQAELREASDRMVDFAKRGGPIELSDGGVKTTRYLLANRSHTALTSGTHLFLKYVTRASLETPDFTLCKSQVLERGTRFAEFSLAARDRIASTASNFIREGSTILTHGRSSVVEALLLRAATVEKKRFKVIVLEGRPDAGGAKIAATYDAAGIPTVLILDSAMGYIAERTRIDMVLVGAEGVAENGGVVNKVGTFALGIVAKELGVPFYVAAESYKFIRMFPLNNADLPAIGAEEGGGCGGIKFVDTLSWIGDGGEKRKEGDNGGSNGGLEKYVMDLPKSITVENPPCDFTPAKYITLLFTDLGVLTPSAVSDELIRLYQ
jgi:translation initiation factor eIF-2B subunit alpha